MENTKTNIKIISDCKREIELVVPKDEVNKEFDEPEAFDVLVILKGSMVHQVRRGSKDDVRPEYAEEDIARMPIIYDVTKDTGISIGRQIS